MRSAALVVVFVACARSAPLPAPADARAPAPDAAPACDLAGDYRLRYQSNGADEWWLRLRVEGSPPAARVTAEAWLLGLEVGPIPMTVSGCRMTLTGKTEHSGDLRIELVLDPRTNLVTGQVHRSRPPIPDETVRPIAGRRDVGPPAGPSCIRPGVYVIALEPGTRWKLVFGRPRFGLSCRAIPMLAETKVRVEPWGDDIIVDSITSPELEGFAKHDVTRKGECEIAVTIAHGDFTIGITSLTFAGERAIGVARLASFDYVEDGEAGENRWTCEVRNARVVATRERD